LIAAGVDSDRLGPVVAALLDAGLSVFVIASQQVTALRSRYGTAGNKDDRFDAHLLADVLRTDRHRLTPLTGDTDATIGLRMLIRARHDLVKARVAATTNSAGTCSRDCKNNGVTPILEGTPDDGRDTR
jgi:Transposase